MDGKTNTRIDNLIWTESYEIVQNAFGGIVPLLRNRFRDLTGRLPHRSWFYEQSAADRDLPKLNIYGRFLFLLALLWFVRRERAEMLMRHCEGVFRWFRATDNPFRPQRKTRSPWDIVIEIEALLIKVRDRVVRREETSVLCLKFQALIDELMNASRVPTAAAAALAP